MSTTAVRMDGQEILYLRPEQIKTDPRYAVRGFGDGEDSTAVEKLAASIERDGQLESGIVVPDGDGYTLFSGHRRRRAIGLINERRSASGQPLLEMRVVVDRTGGDLLRKAIASNLQRKDFSPMDLSLLIQRIRSENKWEGFKGAKKISEYLGLNITTITQHERFGALDGETKEKLHQGVISAQSAFDLLNVKPEKRGEVLDRAAEIQGSGKKAIEVTDEDANEFSEPEVKTKKAQPKERIERPAIAKAIRETSEEADRPVARTRKEIVEFFAEQDGPANGWADGEVRRFVVYFEQWVQGSGTDATLQKKFDAMTAKADKGTKPKSEAEYEVKVAAKAVVKAPVTAKPKAPAKATKAPKKTK